MNSDKAKLQRQLNLIKDTIGAIIETLHLEEQEKFNQLWWFLLKFDISGAEEAILSSTLAEYTEIDIVDLPDIDTLTAEINIRLKLWNKEFNRYTILQLLNAYNSIQLIAAEKFLKKYHDHPVYLNHDKQNL